MTRDGFWARPLAAWKVRPFGDRLPAQDLASGGAELDELADPRAMAGQPPLGGDTFAMLAPQLAPRGHFSGRFAKRPAAKPLVGGSGADENRTHDLLHAMQALCQLSYSPKRRPL
jgi:hypothetical protein